MKNKNFIIAVLVIVIFSGASFFAGMKYQERKTPSNFRQGGFNRVNLNGQFRPGQNPGNNNGSGFRPITGQIISMDEKSITVKMQDDSSKIVLLTDSTKYSKTSDAAEGELKEGDTIAAFGTENSDGSLTAQSVQVNPEFGNFFRRDLTPTP